MGREWQWIPLFSSPTMEGRFESYILTQVATIDLCYFRAVLARITSMSAQSQIFLNGTTPVN
jgi:hypothetical protein